MTTWTFRLRILGAALYDALTLLAVLMLAAIPFVVATGADTVHDPLARTAFQFYLLAISYAFFAAFWRQGNPTLGERAWGVCLRTREGHLPDWLHVNRRFLATLLSLALMGLGWLWALWRGQTLHDQLAGTRLVPCHSPEENPSS